MRIGLLSLVVLPFRERLDDAVRSVAHARHPVAFREDDRPEGVDGGVDRLLHLVGGVALESYYPEMTNSLLICVTETAKKESIDNLVDALSKV